MEIFSGSFCLRVWEQTRVFSPASNLGVCDVGGTGVALWCCQESLPEAGACPEKTDLRAGEPGFSDPL